jgi:hypothetical protein
MSCFFRNFLFLCFWIVLCMGSSKTPPSKNLTQNHTQKTATKYVGGGGATLLAPSTSIGTLFANRTHAGPLELAGTKNNTTFNFRVENLKSTYLFLRAGADVRRFPSLFFLPPLALCTVLCARATALCALCLSHTTHNIIPSCPTPRGASPTGPTRSPNAQSRDRPQKPMEPPLYFLYL